MPEKTEAEQKAEQIGRVEKTMNYILADLERIGQRAKGLTDAQKKKVLDTLTEGVAHVGKVLEGKVKGKSGFTL